MRWRILFVMLGLVICVSSCGRPQGQEQMTQPGQLSLGAAISAGKEVTFDYILVVDGKPLDKGTMEYTDGQPSIIPGLAKRLEGLRQGEEKTIMVPAAEAYGIFDPQAIRPIPRTSLPPNLDIKVGMAVRIPTESGQPLVARIQGVKDDMVILNFNHPLADKDLTFHVKITSVK